MVRFMSAPVEEVAPKRKTHQPSQRAEIRRQYQEALRRAVIEDHQAFVVELEVGDKPLTIRNRTKKAAEALGLENLNIRRRGNRIVAYQLEGEQLELVQLQEAGV